MKSCVWREMYRIIGVERRKKKRDGKRVKVITKDT